MLSKPLETSLYPLNVLYWPLRPFRGVPTPPRKSSAGAALRPAAGGAGAGEEGHDASLAAIMLLQPASLQQPAIMAQFSYT